MFNHVDCDDCCDVSLRKNPICDVVHFQSANFEGQESGREVEDGHDQLRVNRCHSFAGTHSHSCTEQAQISVTL